MTLPRLSLMLVIVGAGFVLAGLLVGPAEIGRIEGAYFTRAAGTPAYSSAFTAWGQGLALLSPHDGNLWLGAGSALLLAALGAAAAHLAGLRLVRPTSSA